MKRQPQARTEKGETKKQRNKHITTTEWGVCARTLLAGGVVDPQAEERGTLAAQQGDVPRGQVQLEHRGVHVLRPEDGVPVVGDPEWVVQLLAVVHHLQTYTHTHTHTHMHTHTRKYTHTHTSTSAHVYAVCGSDGNIMRQHVVHLKPRKKRNLRLQTASEIFEQRSGYCFIQTVFCRDYNLISSQEFNPLIVRMPECLPNSTRELIQCLRMCSLSWQAF